MTTNLPSYAKIIYNASQLAGNKPDTRITVVDNMQYYNYGGDFIALAPTSRNVTEVTLDSRTTEINQYAFDDCRSLISIIISENVTSIGFAAFSGCSSLVTVTFEENSKLTSIGTSAFSSCDSLTTITIPSSVTSISGSAFNYCSSLTSIEVDPANTNYSSEDGVVFNKDKTTLVAYPRGGSEEYTIPSSVTSIGENAFSYCYGLTSIIIPSSVTSIDSLAFSGCRSLTSITIPDSVTSIVTMAFYGCNFSSVTLDSSYAYQRAGDTSSACGYLLEDANTVYVNSALITELGTAANSYLNENFGQPTDNGNGYYVYTRNA